MSCCGTDPEQARIVAALAALARAAPRAVLEAIAAGDSYASAAENARHLRALLEVVERLDCRLHRLPDSSWFPGEAVGLVSYGVDGHDAPTVAVANALLMIEALERDDPYGHMHYRWNHAPGAAWFAALPPELGAPLLEGFALLAAREN